MLQRKYKLHRCYFTHARCLDLFGTLRIQIYFRVQIIPHKVFSTPDFFGRAPPIFGSKSTISRFGERLGDCEYSLVSFLFAVLLLTVPPVSSHL